MIKKILCKLGLHKYKMTHRYLTCCVYTKVRCEWCNHELTAEDPAKEREKKRKKLLSMKLS